MTNKCNSCYWQDCCDGVCYHCSDHYSVLEDENTDERFIENKRTEFMREWDEYVDENIDNFY